MGGYQHVPETSVAQKKVTGPCTCGAVKTCAPNPATGHSDWCDINHALEYTEELPF
jgi:hypothetical protein